MPTFLERYQSGDRRRVWIDLMSLGESVRRKEHIADAKAVARETMLRARDNVETLISRLTKLGYRFQTQQDTMRQVTSGMEQAMRLSRELGDLVPPGMRQIFQNLQQHVGKPATPAPQPEKDPLHHPDVWSRPGKKVAKELDHFEETIHGPLPLSIRAWCENVGSVSLMGSHETLNFRAGGGPMTVQFGGGMPPSDPQINAIVAAMGRAGVQVAGANPSDTQEDPLPDPLVVQPYFDEWEEAAEYAGEECSPTELSLAPDDLHKANISGGDPYGMKIPDPAADAIFTDRNRLLFVDYLRLAFQWGGFPGWAGHSKRPDRELRHLAEGLREI